MSFRFGLLLTLSVDGLVMCDSHFANLLACHSIRFSRFRLGENPAVPCGFPAVVPPSVTRRRGDTLRISSPGVNNSFQLFSIRSPGVSSGPQSGMKNAFRLGLKASAATTTRRPCATRSPLYERPLAVGHYQPASRIGYEAEECGPTRLPLPYVPRNTRTERARTVYIPVWRPPKP